jgi:exodeoxyribonuclease VII large subunit
MPETINSKQVFSLIDVSRSIEKTLSERYKSAFWVQAEMNKLNHYSHSGHCYPDLVEKKDGKVIAQMRANLWKDDFNRVNDNFHRVLKESLKDGIKILFLARISFSPAYGLSLRILDIDPAYTLGDLEKEKQETINLMREQGIFNQNKTLPLPLLPQRIAVISVETSKGFADFIKVIETNEWGYKYFHLLFPALLQGEKAVESISRQLKRIKKVIHHFDAVAIIRGGGGDIGLSCYNHYDLVREIALFPIPVLTGIGHATNETVAEMVSYSNAITPTKMAEYLIQKFHNFSVPVNEAREDIIDKARRLIVEEKSRFHSEVKLFRSVTHNILFKNRNNLQESIQIFNQHSRFLFKNERTLLSSAKVGLAKSSLSFLFNNSNEVAQVRAKFVERSLLFVRGQKLELTNIEKNISNMSPENVLKRGYSITRLDGKAVKDIDKLKAGDLIDTVIYKGKITSRVEGVSND